MYRTLVILRYTFLEAVLQPIYALLLTLGAVIVALVFGPLPFFTMGEDFLMFKSVSLDVILLFVLLATLFATSKSIYDEIEDRTMLTLMSKPVRRWEVVLGKYLGIVLAILLAVLILGGVLMATAWLRLPSDYNMPSTSLNDQEIKKVFSYRVMHMTGLAAQLFLTWLEVSVLAAVGVAISTRFSIVVNLPVVIMVYLAGNLTRFIYPIETGALAASSHFTQLLGRGITLLIPYLRTFDLRDITVMQTLRVPGTIFAKQGLPLARVGQCLLSATAYAVSYVMIALSAGMLSFRNRELGGGEG